MLVVAVNLLSPPPQAEVKENSTRSPQAEVKASFAPQAKVQG